MKVLAATLALFSLAAAAPAGPKFTIDLRNGDLSNGAASLNLEGEYERELVDNVDAGVVYKFNSNRGLPSSMWVRTRADLDDDTELVAKAEYDLGSKTTAIEATLSRGDDSVSLDFDTGSNEVGPVKISKAFDMDGKAVRVEPTINVQDKTGSVVVNAELDKDTTTAEITLDQADESAVLEVSHKLDDDNTVSPKVNLKSGDISVRLNRALKDGGSIEIVADRDNVDYELENENGWTVSGNVPLKDTGKSTISLKRTVEL